MMDPDPILNVANVGLEEQRHGERYVVKKGRMGPAIGLTKLGCTLHVVPAGKCAFPFHAHHVIEELFVILSGAGEYRFGGETFPVKAGDVLGAPAGKTRHQIVNTGTEEMRYLGISTIGSVDVVEYPDSKKVAVAAGIRHADFKTATFVQIAHTGESIDYWDGEPS